LCIEQHPPLEHPQLEHPTLENQQLEHLEKEQEENLKDLEQQQQQQQEQEPHQQERKGNSSYQQVNHHHHPPCHFKDERNQEEIIEPATTDAATNATDATNNKTVVVTKQTTSDAYALYFETISPEAYLTLINRGWRRSGKLLYLPRNWSSCCPAIPIRLETTRFQISKHQKKILLKFQKLFQSSHRDVAGSSMIHRSGDRTATTSTSGRTVTSTSTTATTTTTITTTTNITDDGTQREHIVKCNKSHNGKHCRRKWQQSKRQKYFSSSTTTDNDTTTDAIDTTAATTNATNDASTITTATATATVTTATTWSHTKMKTPCKIKQLQHRARILVLQDCSSLMSSLQEVLRTKGQNVLQQLQQQQQEEEEHQQQEESVPMTTWNQILTDKMDKLYSSWKCSKVSKPITFHHHHHDHHDGHPHHRQKDDKEVEEEQEEEQERVGLNPDSCHKCITMDVTLTNTICASLHGMTRGEIDTMVVAKEFVSCLKQELKCCYGCNHNENCYPLTRREKSQQTDNSSQDMLMQHQEHGTSGGQQERCDIDIVQVCSVTCHEPSGHIHVVVRVTIHDDDVEEDTYHGQKMSNTSIIQDNKNDDDGGSCRKVDIIGQFITSMGALCNVKINNNHSSEQDVTPPYRITVKSVPSNVSGGMPQVHRLYCKYQHAIHGDDDPYMMSQKGSLIDESLDRKNDANDLDGKNYMKKTNADTHDDDEHDHDHDNKDDAHRIRKEQFSKWYPQYNKDQIKNIYKSYKGFQRFLCTSPIISTRQNTRYNTMREDEMATTSDLSVAHTSGPFGIQDSDVTIPYGSYHQHYLINDQYLFAVGVVDILPTCLSSVYSFYDPDLSRTLSLGKITALYEIEWVKHAMKLRPDLRYYYLGYYIHSCQKMKYKAQYKPSELLCPARFVWVDFEQAEKRLESRSPIRHCCNISTPDEEYFGKDANMSHYQLMKTKQKYEEGEESIVTNILFDIGAGTYLSLNMVTDEAKDIIYPLLKSLVDEIGYDIASQCIVKLC
jgi:arginine-tRNA-protein transferase